jgi:hypothetical protein
MKNLPRECRVNWTPWEAAPRRAPPRPPKPRQPASPSYDAPPMRALVTGGAGFIGSNLVDALTPAEV